MNEGRLWGINREVRTRQTLLQMKKVKETEKMHVKLKKWNKEMKNYEYNATRASVPVNKSLNELNAYQIALTIRRRKFKPTKFGMYNGLSHRDMKPAIAKIIRENQPVAKRLKETEKLLHDSVRDGKIVPLDKSKTKFEELMDKPFDEHRKYLHLKEESKSSLYDIPDFFAFGIFGFPKKPRAPKKSPEPEEHQHYRKLVLPPLHVKKDACIDDVAERFRRLGTNLALSKTSKLRDNTLPTTNIEPINHSKIREPKQKTVM